MRDYAPVTTDERDDVASSDLGRAEPFMETHDFERIAQGVALGKYNLLLGAGASVGCSNSNGPVPSSAELEKLLHELSGRTQGSPVGLQRAYEAAVRHSSAMIVEDLLRSRFASVEPSNWHQQLPLLPWETIWTFNIDDSVEYAYQGQHDRLQKGRTTVWSEPPLARAGLADEVPIVHLHGYIGEIHRRTRPELVFSTTDYLRVIEHSSRPWWHSRFRAEYPSMPMIILGASLSSELDLAEAIRLGNTSTSFGYPSIIVLPRISQFDEDEYRAWGLIPIRATAEDFIKYLVPEVSRLGTNSPDEQYTSRYTQRSLTVLMKGSEFSAAPLQDGHDFFGGHDPWWDDIVVGLDAVPHTIHQLANDIPPPAEMPTAQILYALVGEAFSGKSTALLRLSKLLQDKGWRPTFMVGRERLQVNEILNYCANRPDNLLVIDPIFRDAGAIGDILRQAKALNQRLIILGADRTSHVEHLKNTIHYKHVVGIRERIFVEPTDGLWWAIVKRRRRAARLGILEDATEQDSKLHFTHHHRDLFSSLASLEGGDGFITRAKQAHEQLPEGLRGAFEAMALLADNELDSPLNAITAATGQSAVEITRAIRAGGPLFPFVRVAPDEPGVLRLRHNYIGHLVLEHCNLVQNLSKLAANLCLSVAPLVSPQAISRQTLEYRIARALMNIDSVRRLSGSDDVDTWYADLEDAYNWNARYWEQRALGLRDRLDRAYSFARRAVTRSEDAFSLNTLGTILMWRATDPANASVSDRLKHWREAVDALTRSRDKGGSQFEHPYVTFFTYTARLLQAPGVLASAPPNMLEQAFVNWRDSLGKSRLIPSDEMDELFLPFPDDWRTAPVDSFRS
ncbi:MAG: SIR2 family protein [Candidatus Microthrix subdominans]